MNAFPNSPMIVERLGWALSLVVCSIIAVGALSVLSWHSLAEAEPPAAQPLVAEPPDQRNVGTWEPIVGEVVDAVTGKPVDGATVRFTFRETPDESGEPVAELVFRRVGRFTFQWPEAVKTRTDLFVERTAKHPAYQSPRPVGDALRFVLKGEPNRSRDFIRKVELWPGMVVTGQVLDLNGRPAEGILVIAAADRHGWQTGYEQKTTTDANGRYRLVVPGEKARGRIYVIPNHAAAVARAISIDFGEQPVFQLRRGTRLVGRVSDAQGRGVAGVAVRADGGERVPWRVTLTDADGKYSLPPCQYGRYRYVVELLEEGWMPGLPRKGVRLPDVFLPQVVEFAKTAPTERQLDFTPAASVRVTARYTTSDDQPVSGRGLTLSGSLNKVNWWGMFREVPDEPGLYEQRVPRGLEGRIDQNADGGFLRIVRESQDSDPTPGGDVTRFDRDGVSFRIRRLKPASVTLRAAIDGQLVKHTEALLVPQFADPNAAKQIGARLAWGRQWKEPDAGGVQLEVHPDIDILLKLEIPGFKTWQDTVRIPAGEDRVIDVSLEPDGAATDEPQPPVTVDNKNGSGLTPGTYGGAAQEMRIAADGSISYSEAMQLIQMTVFDDGRIQVPFPNEGEIWTDRTLSLVTRPLQKLDDGSWSRTTWSAEIDGLTYRATAIPYSDTASIFRLEKLRGGKLIAGSQQFYAIDQKLRKATPQERANSEFLKQALDAATGEPMEKATRKTPQGSDHPLKETPRSPNDASTERLPTSEEVFGRKVSLRAKGMPLREALAALALAARVTLKLDEPAVAERKLDLDAPVTVTIAEEPLGDVLSQLIDWRAHAGVYRELRGGALVLTTLQATQERTKWLLPEWLKPVYNRGLLVKLGDDDQIVTVTAGEAMTDELLGQLKTLPALRQLELGNTTQITVAGLAHLAELTALEKLSLSSVNTTGEGLGDIALKHVAGLKTLRELQLMECGTTDAGIQLLEGLPQLTHLDIYQEGRLTDAAIAAIAKLKQLRHLRLTSYGGTVRLGRMQFSPEALRQLSVLQDLEVLALPGLTVPADFLREFPRLTSLDLHGEFVTDSTAERIAQRRALRSLSVSGTRITDEGWKKIATLPELRRLSLRRERITDDGIGHLRGLTKLQHLEMRTGALTDAALGHLAEIKSLTRLDLWGGGSTFGGGGSDFTVSGLQQLKQLPNLRTLWLINFQDTHGYRGLKELTQLRELVFEMGGITQEEFNNLEAALPKTYLSAGNGGGHLRSIRNPIGF